MPLVKALEAMFFQFYDQRQVPDTRVPDTSRRLHGYGGLNPTWIKERKAYSPLLLYSWRDTWQALSGLRSEAGDPYDGLSLARVHHPPDGRLRAPIDGLLDPASSPRPTPQAHRHTGSSVYYAARGSGHDNHRRAGVQLETRAA